MLTSILILILVKPIFRLVGKYYAELFIGLLVVIFSSNIGVLFLSGWWQKAAIVGTSVGFVIAGVFVLGSEFEARHKDFQRDEWREARFASWLIFLNQPLVMLHYLIPSPIAQTSGLASTLLGWGVGIFLILVSEQQPLRPQPIRVACQCGRVLPDPFIGRFFVCGCGQAVFTTLPETAPEFLIAQSRHAVTDILDIPLREVCDKIVRQWDRHIIITFRRRT